MDASVEAWVDFNEIDPYGNAYTLSKLATGDLYVGRQLVVGDHEGNTCMGRVIEVSGTVATIQLDRSTFREFGEDSDATSEARPVELR